MERGRHTETFPIFSALFIIFAVLFGLKYIIKANPLAPVTIGAVIVGFILIFWALFAGSTRSEMNRTMGHLYHREDLKNDKE